MYYYSEIVSETPPPGEWALGFSPSDRTYLYGYLLFVILLY